jgi:hypothetical protein
MMSQSFYFQCDLDSVSKVLWLDFEWMEWICTDTINTLSLL